MPPDIFDKIAVDLFDRISLDLFDKIDLAVEDKVIFSKEMADLIRAELRKEIGSLPIGKIIADVMRKEMLRREKADEVVRSGLEKEMARAKAEMKEEISKLKKSEEEFVEKMKTKYADFKNELATQPRYEFGGFSPQVNDLNIGDPATDGNWRIVVSGSSLSIQRRESGSWLEKGAFL